MKVHIFPIKLNQIGHMTLSRVFQCQANEQANEQAIKFYCQANKSLHVEIWNLNMNNETKIARFKVET